MSRSALDALLGRQFDNGTEIELMGGMNWIGFTITPDAANNRYDFEIDASTIDITVPGDTGNALYNNADALAAAAGISVLSTGTAFGFGVTTATGGFLRVGAGLSAAVQNVISGLGTDSSTVIHLVRWGSGINGQLLIGSTTATVGVSTLNNSVQSGGTFRWFTGASGTDIMAMNATTTTYALGMNLVGAPSSTSAGLELNGATVAAPVEGTDLTDANQTLNVSGGNDYVLRAALTANRDKTLGTSGSPETGEVISIKRFSTTAHTVAVINGGAGAGTLYTFPASVKRVADFRYDGTNWVLAGVKRLS